MTPPRPSWAIPAPFNGEDVIDIICQQPATAWFVAAKLYGFFVSDTPEEGAIQHLADKFAETDGNIREVMRALFLSEFFRAEGGAAGPGQESHGVGGRHGPAGPGSHRFPEWSIVNLAMDVNFMGQEILNPPTVEGWHTGRGVD